MALGRQGERQVELMVGWAELPRSPGHVFYDRLQAVLVEAGFDGFAEQQCAPYYASKRGRPSLPPGRYFRIHLVGYFEGIDSERGLEWRCADSLSLREFLRLGLSERVPDHSWLSKTRSRLPLEVHIGIFVWVLQRLAEHMGQLQKVTLQALLACYEMAIVHAPYIRRFSNTVRITAR